MRQILMLSLAVLVAFGAAMSWAEEPAEETASAAEASEPEVQAEAEAETDSQKSNGNGVDSPKTMSGMSILGNEEAPKSLVIIPWKSSRMGDEITLSDTLDDRAQPVDKEVFLRELRFHKIRSGDET
ncbi:MAG: hypothetical protein WBN09_09290 [Woeseiaceae bacterium]